MKKLYLILCLPLLAVFCLTGCSSKYNASTVQNLSNTMIKTYDYTVYNGTANTYFQTDENGNVTFQTEYDNDSQLNSAIYESSLDSDDVSVDLIERYYALNQVYAKTAALIYNYYANWSEHFFADIESKDLSSKEYSNLYDKLLDFKNELATFNAKKIVFESEVHTFGIQSKILGDTISNFNSDYNSLIKDMLSFVNYFAELHNKYYFSNAKSTYEDYRARLYDQSLLDLAEYIYYDYLIALQTSGTSILYQVDLNDTANSQVYNIFAANSYFDKIVSNKNGVITVNLPDFSTSATKVITDAEFDAFEIDTQAFELCKTIYLKVYSDFDMSDHNNYRFQTYGGYDVLDDYLVNKSSAEKLNINIVIEMENDIIASFLSSLASMLK